MDSTVFTAVIILGITVLVIVLFVYQSGKHRDKKFARQTIILNDLIQKNQLEISEKEEVDGYVFAIDKTAYKLLYINFSNPVEQAAIVDLRKVKAARIVTDESNFYDQQKGSGPVEKHITAMQLEITGRDANNTHLLPIYEYKDGLKDMVTLKKRATYWQDMINNCVQQLSNSTKQTVR